MSVGFDKCLDICRTGVDTKSMARAANRIPDPPADVLQDVMEALGSSVVASILGVHPRTLQRRRVRTHGPRTLEVQRAEKLGRIWAERPELFKKEDAIRWLQISNPVVANRPPVDVMTDDGGLD